MSSILNRVVTIAAGTVLLLTAGPLLRFGNVRAQAGPPNVGVEIKAPLPVPVKNAAGQPLLVQNVTQGEVSPAQILPPTGRTIGGPGLFSRSGTGEFFILNATLRSNGVLILPITACATVVATGSSPVWFSTTGDEGGFGSQLLPGDGLTFCNAKADRFTLECKSGPCSAVWRIDEANVGTSRLP